MFKQEVRWARCSVTASVFAALMVAAVSSQAAAFRTRFDPIFLTGFGATVGLPQLPVAQEVGWKGSAEVNVPNVACLTPSTASLDLTGPGFVCGAVTLTNANVTFFNTVSNATLDTIDWPFDFVIGSTPTTFSIDSTGIVSGMVLDLPLAGSVTLNGVSFNASLVFGLGTLGPDMFGLPTLTLTDSGNTQFVSGSECATVDGVNPCKVTAIWEAPEPASLALVGAALALMSLMRRRMA